MRIGSWFFAEQSGRAERRVKEVKFSKYSTNNAIFMEINHYFCRLELYNGLLCPKMKID